MLRSASLVGLLAAAPAALAPSAVPPARVVNARVEIRSAVSGLEREVHTLIGSGLGPLWIGYEVTANRRHQSCCWSSVDEAGSGCGGCRLEVGKGGAFRPEPAAPLPLEGSPRLRVLLRAEGGRIGRVRAFSEDCWLDAGGLPLVWLEGVRPADSVAYLATLASDGLEEDGRGKGLGDGVLAAIAFHEDPTADQALERFAASSQPTSRRRRAAFWMGEARGARGFASLSRLAREDADPRFREHVVFALTQSDQPKAIDAIIEVARRDESPRVRGQALFWLAQTASRRAAEAIETALEGDAEIEVKKKAVFALSQLPSGEGVPHLIRVARTHRTREVRRQAMFWLGQSGDPRALAFFEEVLRR